MSRISSIIVNRDDAKLETIIRFSLCCLVNSDSSVRTVIPMIPFMGVLQRISYTPRLRIDAS